MNSVVARQNVMSCVITHVIKMRYIITFSSIIPLEALNMDIFFYTALVLLHCLYVYFLLEKKNNA